MGDLDLFVKVTDNRRTPAVCRQLWLLRQHGPTDLIHNLYKRLTPPAKVSTNGQGHMSKVKDKYSKKCFVNAITWKIITASLQFTHEYGDDLIRFSAFQR